MQFGELCGIFPPPTINPLSACSVGEAPNALKFLKKNFGTLRQTPCKYCTSECSEKVHSGEMRGVF